MVHVYSLPVIRVIRAAVAAVAIALVLVPALARAQQHVEHRDATRLSIRHSWIGVTPPTRASIAPQLVVAVPAIGSDPEPPRRTVHPRTIAAPARRPVLARAPEPLRGPPSVLA